MTPTFSLGSLFGRTANTAPSEAETPRAVRPPGPLVWLQCGGAADLGAARALAARLSSVKTQLTCLATVPGQVSFSTDANLIVGPDPTRDRSLVRDFVETWRPEVVVCMTGTPDAAVVAEVEGRAKRLILVNATADTVMSVRRSWLPRLARSSFDHFDYVLAADDKAAEALRKVAGLRHAGLMVVGPLQDGARVLPHSERERQDIATVLRTRPVWCAASASLSEINDIAAAHRQASRRSHRLLLVLLPRRIEDAPALAAALQSKGITVGLRSEGAEPVETLQAYVADLGGESGLWYRIAQITYLGGSLSDGGCDDPFEPAALGSATIHGPVTAPFEPHFMRLDAVGGSQAIANGDDLGRAIEYLLSPDRAATLSHAAWDVTSTGSEATERVVELIVNALNPEGS